MKAGSSRDAAVRPDESSNPRAVFTDEFKRQAVKRLRLREQNATELAIELGIRRNQLYKWAAKFDALPAEGKFRSPGRPKFSEEAEVVQLRRQLAKAEEELVILKKFDAYLTRRAK